MKKTITLIMMFVLSVGFLMAQGVFTYQTVVVDGQGKLVVNKPVNAKVTITDDQSHTFVQSGLSGTTSNNGLLVLSIGDNSSSDFNNMNWENATITLEYTAQDVVVPVDYSRIPAVPYALQTNDELTTAKIVEYIKGASMEDVREILDAMDHGTPNLKDTLMATVVDSVKANYKLAKQVFMDYVAHATAHDLDTLYESLLSNQGLTSRLNEITVQFLEDSTEMVYDILRQYALNLTADDVNAIIAAVPDTVKSYMVNKAFEYMETGDAKQKLLIPVVMDYVRHATTSDVYALISSIRNNPNGLYDTMLNKFNSWMDDYFAHHYTGGNNNSFVQTLVNDSMDARYYTCDTQVDLCQLKQDLEELNTQTCFAMYPNDASYFNFGQINGQNNIVGSFAYTGTQAFNVYVESVNVPITDVTTANVDPSNVTIEKTTSGTNKIVEVTIPYSAFSSVISTYHLDELNSFEVKLIITSDCLPGNHSVTVWGYYSAAQ